MNDEDRCASCGVSLSMDARFCGSCGSPRAPLAAATAAASGTPPIGSQPPPGPPAGYPPSVADYTQPQPPMPAQYAEWVPQRRGSGWLIGAAVAGTLAIVGLGVGIYLAISSSSGQTARLLPAPAINSAAASASSTSADRHAARAPHASSSSAPVDAAAATTASTPATDSLTEEHAVASAIQRHFALIKEHRFSEAYALLAPNLRGGESAWVASHRSDGIYSVEVAVNATLHSSDAATASIAKMTTLDAHGCKEWSGSWGLTKIAGTWRISEANLSSRPC